MMRHSAILAGADIAPNAKSELIDYADLKGLTLLYDNIFFDMVPKSAWRGVPEHASSEETNRAFLENFRPFDDLFLVPKSEAPKRWKILQQIWVPLPKELNTAASMEVWTL